MEFALIVAQDVLPVLMNLVPVKIVTVTMLFKAIICRVLAIQINSTTEPRVLIS